MLVRTSIAIFVSGNLILCFCEWIAIDFASQKNRVLTTETQI